MGVIHQHWVCIIDRLLILILLFTAIPSFLYLESDRFQEIVPFIAFEGYLFLVFCKIIYDIFDWYNDVWIITNEGVVDLDWSLFKSNMKTVNYENIEGVEVEKK
ncbi:MAG: hypothetical protein H6767_02400 [Candidatus Peribacteria bacterium]|nr:MAG: hypothetical protein H6767_02400 [Candidatus Peribacteria bacterium]